MSTSSSMTQHQEQRRMALFVLGGLILACLIAAFAAGTRVYHTEVERVRTTAPVQPPAEPGKEPAETPAATLALGDLTRALVTDPLFMFAFVNLLLFVAGALVYAPWANRPADFTHATRPVPPLKLLIAGAGGVLGFTTTTILGVGYAFYYWQDLSVGGLKVWQETWPWLIVLATFGGLIITFASLLAVKSEERSNPTLRRLLYGFNTFLVGFLLLAILVVINGMFAVYGTTQAIDWTQSQLATLSPVTKRLLASLEKPVEIYVLGSRRDLLAQDMETLMKNCQSYTSNLEVRFLSATSRQDLEAIDAVMKKYGLLFQEGMLVVHDPAGENNHIFVKREASGADDLGLEDFGTAMMPGEAPRSNFRGEQALVSALNQLLAGKVKATIYVTQDSGEFSLKDSAPAAPGARGGRSLATLKTRLEKAGYQVEPWQLGLADEETRALRPIPEDAVAVLIAGPNAVIAEKLQPLVDYMKRPEARLLIFVEPTRDREGRVQPTGLEGFLTSFGVQIGQDRILHPATQVARNPSDAIVLPAFSELAMMPSMGMDSRLEAAYFEEFGGRAFALPLGDSRSVRFGPAEGFETRPLLLTAPLFPNEGVTGQWAETEPVPDAAAFIQDLMQNRREELNKRLVTPQIPVAVTVTDAPAAQPPAAMGRPPASTPGKPRIVVFGSVEPLRTAGQENAQLSYFFVASSLSWLRDRDVSIDSSIKVKQRHYYTVRVPPESIPTLRWLPPLFLLLFVVALGVSVSLMRRR